MMKLAVLGAAGRMGGALIRAIDETNGAQLSGALERPESDKAGQDSGLLAGIEKNDIPVSVDVSAVLEHADAVLDFTAPAVSVGIAKIAGQHQCIHVIGTTGCSEEENAEIKGAAASATIVKSGNMSLGINLLAAMVEKAASVLGPDEFDIEVLEMHHRHKVDAPSGTALLLGEAAATGRNIDLGEKAVRVRDGITGARDEGTVGFATLRGGGVIGDHSVIFAGSGERIELSHKAQDRSLFAKGAVHAALWASGKPHGLYSMRDVLDI